MSGSHRKEPARDPSKTRKRETRRARTADDREVSPHDVEEHSLRGRSRTRPGQPRTEDFEQPKCLSRNPKVYTIPEETEDIDRRDATVIKPSPTSDPTSTAGNKQKASNSSKPIDRRRGHQSNLNAHWPKSTTHADGRHTDSETSQPDTKSGQLSSKNSLRQEIKEQRIKHMKECIEVAEKLHWKSLKRWEALLKELKAIKIEDISDDERRKEFLRSYLEEIEREIGNLEKLPEDNETRKWINSTYNFDHRLHSVKQELKKLDLNTSTEADKLTNDLRDLRTDPSSTVSGKKSTT